MSKSYVDSTRVHPRRRPVLNADLPSLVTESAESSKMGLKKGETFHTPTSPPSTDRDPILNIRSLPRRCPTSLDALAASEERMTSILNRLTLDSPEDSGEESSHSGVKSPQESVKKTPTGPKSGSHTSRRSSVDDSLKKAEGHEHDSDSGLGTSVSSDDDVSGNNTTVTGTTTSVSLLDSGLSEGKRQLSLAACKKIERHILLPILKDPKLKPFHPLAKSIPSRILNRHIVCLRDVEKSLLWLAPVRRYAAMIRASRERAEQAQAQNPEAHSEGKLSLETSAVLEGGISKNGKPAELVVLHEGKQISMLTGEPFVAAETPATFKRGVSFDERADEGVQRSMARRKKNAPPMDINQKCSHCEKIFKRPCDLTKHEKTHSRPWKCSDSTCKFFSVGWPTQKERDRHENDKHSSTPAMYKCNFQPCPYTSKRESNCKQHMEKAHGWVYVRSKNNSRMNGKRGTSTQASRTPSVSTPASKSVDFPTPVTGPSPSPAPCSSLFDSTPFNFNDPPVPQSDDYPRMFETSPYTTSSAGLSTDFTFPTSLNLDSFQTQFESGDPNELIPSLEMHRQISVPSAGSVPDLMGMSGYDGSPQATTENSLNFELDWNNLGYNDMDTDYTALHMQMQTPGHPENIYQGYSGPMTTDPSQLPINTNKMSGLSPNAQGNPMLYSPGSEHYEYNAQLHGGNDFMLYGEYPGMNMQMVPPITQHQSTRQFAQPRQEGQVVYDMELEYMK